MSEEKLTYKDVEEYEKLFSMVPPFLLERFAKKNSNLVKKFESKVLSFSQKLNPVQQQKLDILLKSDVTELQSVMNEAYQRNNKKQYKILANPDYKEFIENNLEYLRNLLKT